MLLRGLITIRKTRNVQVLFVSAEAAKDVMDFGCRNVVNGKTLYIVLIVNGRLNQIF